MDKLNLMKAVLTLYVSAVVAVFLFRPTVKEFLPARIHENHACILTLPVRKEKLMAQYLLIGNSRYPAKQIAEKCFEVPKDLTVIDENGVRILLVKQGRSLWNTLIKK